MNMNSDPREYVEDARPHSWIWRQASQKRNPPAKQCGLSGKELVNESVIPERATWVNKTKTELR